MKILFKYLLPALLLALAGAASASSLKPLTAETVPQLLKAPAHGERIIMFWALHCTYCEPNMKALARLQRAHPQDIQLVLVDTDDIHAHRKQIQKRLTKAGMADYPAWAYTEAVPQRLNYLVDSTWGGETPRTLAILADGRKAATSGELTEKELAQLWPLQAATSQPSHPQPMQRMANMQGMQHMKGTDGMQHMQYMDHAGNAAKAGSAPAAPENLHISKAWVRLLPGKLPAGGYFNLRNDGDTSVTLTGASSPAYAMAMLHKSEESGGLSRMVHVKTVIVPAHGSIQFAPGGYHLMLMHAKKPLQAGGTIKITLHFANGGTLTVPFKLRPAAAMGP